MAAAKRLGALIFENSRVIRIDRDHEGVMVKTRRGVVRARCVVIATGYATAEFRPLAGRFRMMHTYVIATERLTGAMRRQLGPRRIMLWDTERPYHYARWTRDGRRVFGGADRPRVRGGRRRRAIDTGAQSLRQHFITVFPALESVDVEYAWEGLFAMTVDGLPYIGPHRRYPQHLFALGYGGNGMTFGFLASRLLLEQYQGVRSRDHDLFAFGRTRR
jgi:glycine/D-amino acid oxidase-like deaminating enzyme